MVAIQFFSEGEPMGDERSWPAVPRVGEGVAINGVVGAFKVADIVWHQIGDRVYARVHLNPLAPQ